MTRANDLGKDPVGKLVLRLAVPSMVAQFVNVLYSLIDRIYIGNIPGTGDLALAGVGVCGPIVTLLTSFGTLVGMGGSILMSIRLGEGRREEAHRVLSNCFMLLAGFSAVLTVAFLASRKYLLLWFGASPATFPYADTYLTIYTAGTFFALMAMGLNYFITCQGFSTAGMLTVLLGAIANILLDPIFIFGLGLGVAGAALATVLAQMLSCGFALWFLFSKLPPVRITFGGYDLRLAARVCVIGLSPFLILATDSVILIVMNAVLQRYGGAQQGDLLIACATIVQSYMSLITGPMLGISGGTQAIISYNYGAAQSARVRRAEKYILALCLCFTTLMFVFSQLVPMHFARVFSTDPALLDLAAWGIRTFTLAIIPLSFQYVLVDGLTALARTKTALFLSMFRKFLFISFTLALPMLAGAQATFYAEPLADVVASCVSTAVFLLVFDRHLARRERQCLPTA